jgi:hypothetical protein
VSELAHRVSVFRRDPAISDTVAQLSLNVGQFAHSGAPISSSFA